MPCGDPHTYQNINENKINKIIDTLKSNGATIEGSNPWQVDTNKYGVKLTGSWDLATNALTVDITDKNFLVPCTKIWENLDPMISSIASSDIA